MIIDFLLVVPNSANFEAISQSALIKKVKEICGVDPVGLLSNANKKLFKISLESAYSSALLKANFILKGITLKVVDLTAQKNKNTNTNININTTKTTKEKTEGIKTSFFIPYLPFEHSEAACKEALEKQMEAKIHSIFFHKVKDTNTRSGSGSVCFLHTQTLKPKEVTLGNYKIVLKTFNKPGYNGSVKQQEENLVKEQSVLAALEKKVLSQKESISNLTLQLEKAKKEEKEKEELKTLLESSQYFELKKQVEKEVRDNFEKLIQKSITEAMLKSIKDSTSVPPVGSSDETQKEKGKVNVDGKQQQEGTLLKKVEEEDESMKVELFSTPTTSQKRTVSQRTPDSEEVSKVRNTDGWDGFIEGSILELETIDLDTVNKLEDVPNSSEMGKSQ